MSKSQTQRARVRRPVPADAPYWSLVAGIVFVTYTALAWIGFVALDIKIGSRLNVLFGFAPLILGISYAVFAFNMRRNGRWTAMSKTLLLGGIGTVLMVPIIFVSLYNR